MGALAQVHWPNVLAVFLRWLLSLALLTAASTSASAAPLKVKSPLSVDAGERLQLSVPQRPHDLPHTARLPLSPPQLPRRVELWPPVDCARPPAESTRSCHVASRIHLPRRRAPAHTDDDDP
jgi:hypothetical protein